VRTLLRRLVERSEQLGLHDQPTRDVDVSGYLATHETIGFGHAASIDA
jgi:hypothetical protein